MKEEWRDIKGYEGKYQISNHGNVKALSYNRSNKEKIMKPHPSHKTAHLYINLRKDRKLTHKRVHRLVIEAFLSDCPEGMECMHIDNNPENNNINNLKWGTRSDNVQHMWDSGRRDFTGEKSPRAILTDSMVKRIKFIKQNVPVKWGYWSKLSRALGISKGCIFAIINNRNWKHI